MGISEMGSGFKSELTRIKEELTKKAAEEARKEKARLKAQKEAASFEEMMKKEGVRRGR
ncbi:hypothetical protein [Hydrogenimonas sp.]